MSSFITSASLGLFGAHQANQNMLGGAAFGQRLNQTAVNLANGNLIVQRQDQLVMARGVNSQIVQTYNSLGQDSDGDNWWFGASSSLTAIPGEHKAGSVILRRNGDGSQTEYAFDVGRSLYVATDGDGAHDTLMFDSARQQWIWQADANSRETYDNQGRILSSKDASNNKKTYTYQADRLVQIVDASGQTTHIDYLNHAKGMRISAIRTTGSGSERTDARFDYDSLGRLTKVSYDLTPEDNSIADNKLFSTRYSYDGDSQRIASLTNSDGSSTRFSYKQHTGRGSDFIAQGAWVLASMTDGEGRTLSFDYDAVARSTDIIDEFGQTTSYRFDAKGQLLSVATPPVDGTRLTTFFGYDDAGNLLSKRDNANQVSHYQYDDRGNLLTSIDANGRRIDRRYNVDNQLIAEIRYRDFDYDGMGDGTPEQALVQRYLYDDKQQLRFVLSDNGAVTEYRYNDLGQQIESVIYTKDGYPVGNIDKNADLSLEQLSSWASNQNLSETVRTVFEYDFRGQLSLTRQYDDDTIVSSNHFLYDYAGRLLSQTDGEGATTSLVYDGLGRRTRSQNALGEVTLVTYDDAAQRVQTTYASGKLTTEVFNRDGDLIEKYDSYGNGSKQQRLGYIYDDLGRLRISESVDGGRSYYFYDAANRKTGQIDVNGQLSTWEYNQQGAISRFTRHANTVDPRALASGQGSLNEAMWNLQSFILQASSSQDSSEHRIYDGSGLLRFLVDAQGTVTEHTYDGLGQLSHKATYEKQLDVSSFEGGITENQLIAALYDLKVASVNNDVVMTGRDPVQPYQYLNHAQLQDRYLDTQIIGVSKTGGFEARNPNQPYGYINGADHAVYVEKDSFSDVEQIRLSDGRQALRWSPNGLPWPKVELGYRILHNNDQFEYLPVSFSNGQYYVELPQLERDEYEIRFAYKDAYSQLRSQSGGAFTQLRETEPAQQTIQVRNFESYWAINTGAGSSLSGVIPANLYANLEKVTAVVYQTDSESVRTDLNNLDFITQADTLASAYPAYQGQVNLSLGQALASGRYQVHLTLEHKDGTISTLDPFLYEVGSQSTGKLSQTLSWPVETFENQAGAVHSARYRSGYRNTGWTSVPVTVVDGQYQIKLDELTAGEYYEVELVHEQGPLNYQGEVENRTSSTFLFQANDTDTLIEARGQRYSLSDLRLDGSAISGVYSKAEAANIDYVLADVFDKATGRLITSAYTYMSGYEDYQGQINLSTEKPLDNGQYRIELRAYHRSSNSQSSTKIFDYEIGQQQETTRPSLVTIKLDDLPDNAEPYYFFPQLNGARYLKGEVNADKELVVAVNDLFVYDNREVPDGLFDMFIQYRDKQTGEMLDRYFTQIKINYDSHDSVVTDFDNPLQPPKGKHEQFYYDAQGRLVGQTDRNGAVTELRYDNAGQLIEKIRYADVSVYGSSQSFETWDAMLARLTPSNDDQHSRFIYDDAGRKLADIDAEGYLTAYSYDANGRVLSRQRFEARVSNPAQALSSLLALLADTPSRTTSYTYDALGRVSQEREQSGLITTNTYDTNGKLTSRVRLDTSSNTYGQGMARQYDAFGRVTAELDPVYAEKLRGAGSTGEKLAIWQNYATHFIYDDSGRMIHSYQDHAQVKNSTGSIGSARIDNWYYYNAAGQLTYSVSDTGVVTQNEYDSFGRLAKVRQYHQAISTSGLTGGTQLTQVSQRLVLSGSDLVTATTYDRMSRVTSNTDVRGLVSSINYDVYGRVASRFVPDSIGSQLGLIVNYQYDGEGHLLKSEELANGQSKTAEYGYDAFGRQTDSRGSDGSHIQRSFDHLGREIQQTNAQGNSRQLSYDAFSRIIREQDALGRITQYLHDDSSNRVTFVYPDNLQVQHQQDAFGNLLKVTDAKGNVSEYSYDEQGRVISSTYKDANAQVLRQTSNKFNTQGLLAESTDGNGSVSRYYYDAANNRVEQVLDANGTALRTLYAYDALGRQIEITQADGTKTQIRFDSVGQMVEQVVNADGTPQVVTRYAYDDKGNRVRVTQSDQTGAELLVTSFSYDSRNRLIEKIEDPAGLKRRSTYRYNANDQMIHSHSDGGQESFQAFDEFGLNQLRFSVSQSGMVTEYRYDAGGQKIETLTYAKAIATSGLADALAVSTSPRTEIQQRLHDRPLFDSRPGTPQGQLTELDNHGLSYFDGRGNRVFNLSGNGYLTEYFFDGNGNQIAEKHYKDSVLDSLDLVDNALPTLANIRTLLAAQTPETKLEYSSKRQVFDGLNRLQYSLDGNDFATFYEYDNESRLIRTTRYATRANVSNGDIGVPLTAGDVQLSVTEADTLVQTLYDKLGRQQYAINSEGYVTEYVHNSLGQVTGTLKYQQAVIKRPYTDVASLRSQLNPGTAITTRNWFDSLGQRSYELDSQGYLTAYKYDGLGRVLRTERTSVTVVLAANADEAAVQLAFIRVPAASKKFNQIENFSYDNLGRLTSKNNGRGQAESYGYDIAGNRLFVEDVRGLRTYFSYDLNGRVSRKLVPISDTQGRVIDYAYNDRGMLIRETQYATAVNLFDAQGAHLTAAQVSPPVNTGEGGDTAIRYDYDAGDRLIRKTQVLPYLDGATASTELTSEFSYNGFNQIVEQVLLSGTAQERRTQFVYDGEGQLIREIKAAGSSAQSVTEYRYDAFGYQTHIIDARGVALAESDSQWALEARQEKGWVVNTAQGVRAKFAHELTAAQREQAKLDFAEISAYDELGRVVSVTNANGDLVRTEYNAQGDVIRHLNPAGQQSIMLYDEQHRVRFAIDARGVVSEYRYNARGDIDNQRRYQVALDGGYSANTSVEQLATLVNQRPGQAARITAYAYNNLGQVVEETDPMGNKQSYEYDAAGNVTAITDKNGNRTEKLYDVMNHLVETRSPQVSIVTNAGTRETTTASIVTRYEYNLLGQRISETKAVGTPQETTTRYEFDALGREVRVLQAARLVANGTSGAQKLVTPTETRQYDLAGNLVRVSDNLGRTQTKFYDNANRLTHWVDGDGLLRSYDYDASGHRVAERVYLERVTNKDSETFVRYIAQTADYRETHYHYDDAGRMVGQSGNDAQYYNAATGFNQSNGRTQIIYNRAGQEAISIDARGVAQYTYYDAAGNAVLTINGDGFVSTREYDANGNNVRETVFANALTSAQLSSLHADTGVSSITGMLQSSSKNRTTEFSYDALNRVVEQRVKNLQYSTPSGGNVTIGMADFTTRYQYDANGNVLLTEVGGIKNGLWVATKTQASFEYDALNRQIKAADTSFSAYDNSQVTPTRLMAFDGIGNQVLDVQDNSLGTVGEIDAADKITVREYDKFGRLMKITAPGDIEIRYVYDQYGNVIVKREKQTYLAYQNAALGAVSQTRWLVDSYSYDAANRQTGHVDAEGISHSTSYNNLGQVIAKGTMGKDHSFYEYDLNGRLTFSNDQGKHRRFFYDENGNASLVVSSTGTRLDDKSMAWMLAADKQHQDFHFTVNRFDGRNNTIESIDPELEYLRKQANAAPPIGNVSGSNFNKGAATVALGGEIDVKFYLMASGSKKRQPEQTLKQFGVSFNVAGMDDYSGKLRFEWSDSFSGYGTHLATEADLSKGKYHFYGINSPKSFISGKDEFNRYGVTANGKTTTSNITERGFIYSIKTYKQDAQGNWVYYKTLTGTYGWEGKAPGIDQYNSRSYPTDKHSVPALVTLSGQPEDATRVSFYYRTKGSSDTFSKLLASKGDNGRFAVDVSGLAMGEYEYYYQATDSIGKVINGATGNMTLGDTPLITHTNTARPDLSRQSLEVMAEQGLNELRHYGSSKSQVYNAFGQIQSTTDGRGNTTSYSYDNRGQLIQRTDPGTSVTGENGLTTRINPVTRYAYDLQGNQVAETDANSQRQVREYQAGKLTKITYADGATQSYGYDVFGQMRTERTKDNKFVNYSYDAAGQVVKVDRAGRNDDMYVYNQQGQQLRHETGFSNVATGAANVSYFEYDRLNRVTRAIDPAGDQTQYSYSYSGDIGFYGGWAKQTIHASGDISIEHNDELGRMVWKQDMGGQDYHYYYGVASGQLDLQVSSRGQDIRYSYFSNGLRKQIDDIGANNYATFNYDANGNTIGEEYFYLDAGGEAVYSQQTVASFDELNRLSRITDTGVDIRYDYDAVGNRRRIRSDYTQINNISASVDHWYTYDAANRVVISKGDLENGQVVRGDGVKISYDSDGRRKTVENAGGSIESYSYNAFGWLMKVDVDGDKRVVRTYYDGGYLKSVEEYRPLATPVLRWRTYREGRFEEYGEPYLYYPGDNRGQLASTTNYIYNAAGQKRSENVSRYDKSGVNNENSSSFFALDKFGNLLSSSTSTSTLSDGQWHSNSQTTRYSYEKWDNYKQVKIEVAGQTSEELRYTWANGLSKLEYDVNGNLVSAADTYAGRLLSYVNSFDGKVLVRHEEAPSYTKTHRYFYYDGIGVGDIGDDGPSYRDYAGVLSDAQRQRSNSKEQAYRPVMAADFDANYVPLDRQSGVGSGRYTVQAGDTLMGIATQLWGDKSLWYLIADANGLRGTERLNAGTSLTLPNVASTNLHHNVETFRPYNPGAAMGDVNPTLPEVPPPPIPPQQDGCGGVAMIVMVVVAVVATVFTAGAAAIAMGAVSSATAAAGAWAAGTAVLTGAAGFGVGVAAAAFAGGFVGSAASQLVGMAMGVVDSFSLRKAVVGGLTSVATAGIGAGLREFASLTEVSKTGTELSRAGKIWQAGLSVPMNAGVNELAGIDTSFSWGNVAVSVLSTAAMTTDTMTDILGGISLTGSNDGSFDWNNVMNGTTGGIVGAGVGYALGRALLKGDDRPSWNFKEVASNAFGNAVGEEINRSRSKAGMIAQQEEEDRKTAEAIDPDIGKFSPVEQFDPQRAYSQQQQKKIIAPAAIDRTYTVKPGDSLSEISEALYGDAYLFTKIAAANDITDPNYGIQAGQKLKVPGLELATEDYRGALHQQGRSEIGRLGNEALDAIRNFDYASLYNSDFSENFDAARELTVYHRRAALDANITYGNTSYQSDGYLVDFHNVSLNNREVYSHEIKTQLPTPPIEFPKKELSLLEKYALYGSRDITPLGAIQTMPAWGSLAYQLNDAKLNGISSLTSKGTSFFNLGDNLVILDGSQRPGFNPDQLPTDRATVKSALTKTGMLRNAVKGGAKFGGPLAALGTVLEYAITPEKQFYSSDFAIDVVSDSLKGISSGAVGGAATTAVIGLATIAGITVAAPVVIAGAVVGFAASYVFGEYGYDKLADPVKGTLKDFFN